MNPDLLAGDAPRARFDFLSKKNAQSPGPVLPGIDISIGEEITVWVGRSNSPEPLGVAGILLSYHVDVDGVCFDVAFPVAGQEDLYIPVRNLSCRITRRNEAYDGSPLEPERPAANVSGLRLVVHNGKDVHSPAPEANVDIELPMREAQPGDDQPVRLSYSSRYYQDMHELMPAGAEVEGIPGLCFTVLYPNRQAALAHLAKFWNIRTGWELVSELDETGVIVNTYGPRPPADSASQRPASEEGVGARYVAEYPTTGEIWHEMTVCAPTSVWTHVWGGKCFQLSYPTAEMRESEVARFKTTFPSQAEQVKLIEPLA